MVIGILTDFGWDDGAVAVMKGVIKTMNAGVDCIDIAHEIKSYNIKEASFVLYRAYKYYPAGTIFLCVVDPGVGSKRKGIVVRYQGYYFVLPDNGLMSYVLWGSRDYEVWDLSNGKYHRKEVSHTFHGRDIFAPVCGHLSLGVGVQEFGMKLEEVKVFDLPVGLLKGDHLEAEVVFIDQYGNIITSIGREAEDELVGERFEVEFFYRGAGGVWKKRGGWEFWKVLYYQEKGLGEKILYFGSCELLELGLRESDLRRECGLEIGDRVMIK